MSQYEQLLAVAVACYMFRQITPHNLGITNCLGDVQELLQYFRLSSTSRVCFPISGFSFPPFFYKTGVNVIYRHVQLVACDLCGPQEYHSYSPEYLSALSSA
jgi:hypothetical protein